MAKPCNIKFMNNPIVNIERFKEILTAELDGFVQNMKKLNVEPQTYFEWFYTLGWWNESLEYMDEFPEQRKCMLDVVMMKDKEDYAVDVLNVHFTD